MSSADDAGVAVSADLRCPELRSGLVRRICESDGFRRSRRLCDFLQYICEKTIDGELAEINERQIAVDVFGREDGSYDPSLDNAVRVQARNLRQKLAEYFHGPGINEPVVIEVPKGGYLPIFAVRQHSSCDSFPTVALTFAEREEHNALPRRRWLNVAITSALVLSLAVNTYFLLRATVATASAGATPGKSLVSALLERGKSTVVVVPDTGYVIAQVLKGSDLSLQQYGEAAYRSALFDNRRDSVGRAFWGYIISRHFTDISSMDFYGRLVTAVPPELGKLELKHPRTLSLQDFTSRNVILLGSPRSNPWVEAFENQLTFRFESDGHGREFLRNAKPLPGESTLFTEDQTKLGVGRVIGLLSLIPNPYGSGRVLIAAGANAAVTDALGIVALTPQGLDKLSDKLAVKDVAELRSIEAVISAEVLGNAVKDWNILSSRVERVK